MTLRTTFLLTASAALLSATAALSDGTYGGEYYSLYGKAGGWEIWANETTGGCFLQDRNNNGNLVQIGLRSSDPGSRFVGVWDRDAQYLAPGQAMTAQFSVNDRTYAYRMQANDVPVTEGYHGVYAWVDDEALAQDMYEGNRMVVTMSDGRQVTIDLSGSRAAMTELARCHARQV